MFESVSSIILGDAQEGILESTNEVFEGVGAELADEGLDLGKKVLDRVEVGRVSGQVKQLAASALD